jgi:hypothetical protein
MEEKVYFSRTGPGLGHDPGLLGYGLKILDRTISVSIPKEHRAKFQFSRCTSGQKIGDRLTDGQTT